LRHVSDTKKPTKARLKKKKSDLPEAAVLPSGETAAPLPEWQGGLQGLKRLSNYSSISQILRV
jgi:hypothetical protein